MGRESLLHHRQVATSTLRDRLHVCAEKHTSAPMGYLAWHEWAEKKAKTHDQFQCPTCGLWAMWKRKKEGRGVTEGRTGTPPPERLTFADAVHAIRDQLTALRDAPHEEHFGPLCPICGVTTALLIKLEDWRP